MATIKTPATKIEVEFISPDGVETDIWYVDTDLTKQDIDEIMENAYSIIPLESVRVVETIENIAEVLGDDFVQNGFEYITQEEFIAHMNAEFADVCPSGVPYHA